MRFLAVSDLDARTPKFRKFIKALPSLVKKERVDAVLFGGDLCDMSPMRSLIFKHWDRLKKESLPSILGARRYLKLFKTVADSMDIVLETFSQLSVPVYAIYGNNDVPRTKKGIPGLLRRKPSNVHILKQNAVRLGEVMLIGFCGYRGIRAKGLSRKVTKALREKNARFQQQLSTLGRKVRNTTVFMAHDVPYGVFDKVDYPESPMHGKRIGDPLIRKALEKYQPTYYLCGHMHEYEGKRKLGKTTIIKLGPGFEGKYVIVDTKKKKIQFKRV